MFNAIFNFLFSLIGKLADIILSPAYLLFDALIPNASEGINTFFNFLAQGLSWIPWLSQMLLIPGVAMGIFITYILAKFTFNISLNVVKFALNVYDKLKL